jgi:CIC family chloride channel protein
MLYWGLKLVGNQGASNILEVVIAGNGRLPVRTALIKAFSSIFSISTGASIGREGSIAQLAATFSSKFGTLFKWPPYRLRLLVACGAASGMSAAYNAPVAAAIYSAQIVLGNFSMNMFGPLVFSTVVATMVTRSFFGLNTFYQMPNYNFSRLSQLPWFLVLGVLSGIVAAAFLLLLRKSEEFFGSLKIPIFVRMTIAGLVVGILAVWFPNVWGNGYAAINEILHQPLALWFLAGLFLAKTTAILATVGSGAVGGVFTPTLFIGAALGSIFGHLLHLGNLTSTEMGAFALVGMGSLLAGTTHAPLLAMIMMFEISLNYSIMPPLMLACAVSTLVSRSLHRESIYTEPLRKKGIQVGLESDLIGAATHKLVSEIMREPVPPVRETASLRHIADRFLTNAYNFLPVVDETSRLLGIVALHDLKEYLNAGQELGVIAMDIMRPPPACLTPNQRLSDVLPILLKSEQRNIPVVNNLTEFRLVGAVARLEALSFISDAISSSKSAAP